MLQWKATLTVKECGYGPETTMKTEFLVSAVIVFSSIAYGGRYNVRPSTSPDRVRSPLQVDMERIGTLAPQPRS